MTFRKEHAAYDLKPGEVTWQSPSNIALVKYWGKKGFQLPANPSLSITLSESRSETTIKYSPVKSSAKNRIRFFFDGKYHPDFELKIHNFLGMLHEDLPFVRQLDFEIHSNNTFPHSAGIASSASAMSALALCLCSIENVLAGKPVKPDPEFFTRASGFARIGSGSASRSVFGRMATWGQSDKIPGSSDLFATEFLQPVHPVFEGFNDTILIVSEEQKKVSSRAGHALMEGNPFAEARYAQARDNLERLIPAIESGNLDVFIPIVESEALTLHGMMMASDPGYMLLEPETVEIIKKIKAFREQSGANLCFTLDAGPNVHVLYPENEKDGVRKFIMNELRPLCENNRLIEDKMGNGPKRIGNDD